MVRLNKNIDFDIFDYKELDNYGIEYSFTTTAKGAEKDNAKIYGQGFSSEPIDGLVRKNKIYQTWIKILRCCYGKINEQKEFAGTICDEWLDYANFRKWYEDNYYEVEGEEIILTRNLIKLDNCHFSPETCIFAPRRVATAMRTNFKRSYDLSGNPLPYGVIYHKQSNNYHGVVVYNGKRITIGTSENPDELLPLVKMAKRKEMKRIAEMYKNKVPSALYDAILNFDFEYFFSLSRGKEHGE